MAGKVGLGVVEVGRSNPPPPPPPLNNRICPRTLPEEEGGGFGAPHQCFSRDGILLPSSYADGRSSDDVIAIEGLGGRYDATNIIPTPAVSGITSLGLDHTAILGHTLPEIAFQKAGIFKASVPAFTVPQDPAALQTLVECAKEGETPLLQVPPLADYTDAAPPAKLGLPGLHQKSNASLALQLCRTWFERATSASAAGNGNPAAAAAAAAVVSAGTSGSIGGSAIAVARAAALQDGERSALEACTWPGRNQIIERGEITYLLDGAHTADSCKACAAWMEGIFRGQDAATATASISPHRTLVFNCSGGRDARPLLEPLADICTVYPVEQALFTPNFRSKTIASADNTNFTMDISEQLEESKACQAMWLALLKERGLEGSCRTTAYGCLDECMERVQSLPFEQSQAAATGATGGAAAAEPQTVLITGSLHLVGGVLSILGCPVV